MKTYQTRTVEGATLLTTELPPPPEGFEFADTYPEQLLAACVELTNADAAKVERGGMWQVVDGKPQPFEPPAEEPPVPSAVTPLQARNALRLWGIGRAEIAAFIGAIEDEDARETAEDAWEYATLIERDNPLIAQCAAFLGKSAEEIDQFFRDAAEL